MGMGKSFFDISEKARALLKVAQEKSGLELERLCLEGPMDELTETINLQPAITLINLVCWQALSGAGLKPYAVAGHSLGEYAALTACGCLSAEKALELVSLRGRIMHEQALANPGTMAAVVGLSSNDVKELCEQAGGMVQPANYNTQQQTVITGSVDAVAAAGELIKARKGKVIPLKVSGPWHSPLMQKAAEEMARVLTQVEFSVPYCLQIPNASGQPSKDPVIIKDELIRQITASVHWVQSIERLLEAQVNVFIEVGPKNVLSGMVRKIVPAGAAEVYNVEDVNTLQETLKSLE